MFLSTKKSFSKMDERNSSKVKVNQEDVFFSEKGRGSSGGAEAGEHGGGSCGQGTA